MKRIIALIMVFALSLSFASISFAKETKDETVTVTDKVTGETKKVSKSYYKEIERQNNERIKKYETANDIAFIDNIIKIKAENPNLSTEELVKLIFEKNSGEVGALAESTTAWDKLTPDEKWLVVLYPKEALVVDACKKDTDTITNKKYPKWKDGDKGNAFRHALWNAMMTLNIGRSLAKSFADAHEAVVGTDGKLLTDAQLKLLKWNGFDGLQHKNMDLHNNGKGRDCVAWYEFFTSNDTLAKRVQTKIDNGEMVILVK